MFGAGDVIETPADAGASVKAPGVGVIGFPLPSYVEWSPEGVLKTGASVNAPGVGVIGFPLPSYAEWIPEGLCEGIVRGCGVSVKAVDRKNYKTPHPESGRLKPLFIGESLSLAGVIMKSNGRP